MPGIVTRKPTGNPSWPMLLIAGREKAGKSYASAEASTSDLIGRTLWVTVGEDEPDELGALPGARFEIVEHDGTYRGILGALTGAAAEPVADGKRNLIVLDSGSRLWDLFCDEQQVEANRRARVKAEKYKRPVPDEDVTITMDQWNTAKQRWGHCLDALRQHQGPSIITARLEDVTVLDNSGKPTSDRAWKVKAEKNLTYEVGCIIELHSLGESYLTGVKSLRYKPGPTQRTEYKPFTVDRLWRDLGLTENVGERRHSAVDAEDKPAQEADRARAELRSVADQKGWDLAALAAAYADLNEGASLKDTTNAAAIRRFAGEYAEQQAAA